MRIEEPRRLPMSRRLSLLLLGLFLIASRASDAAGAIIGTGPDDEVRVEGPPKVVTGNRGQTVYLDYKVRNNSDDSVALRYVPTFRVVRGSGVVIRSVSGKPSSGTSTQTVSKGSYKKIRLSVKVDNDAPAGDVLIQGAFAFTSPATVAVDGTISIPGAARIGVSCRNEFTDARHIRVVVTVKNLFTETVKAVRASRVVTDKEDGGSFTVQSGRSPSVVYKLAPGATTDFSFTGAWNGRGVVHIFESATAATQLNQKLVSDTVECQPPLQAGGQ
jgi:hypothetical protein